MEKLLSIPSDYWNCFIKRQETQQQNTPTYLAKKYIFSSFNLFNNVSNKRVFFLQINKEIWILHITTLLSVHVTQSITLFPLT